jgi:serine/threonine protein phosphatase PrpC
MHPVGGGISDVGRERDLNEDSFYLDDERRLYIVSDGMGGHASGEVASALAIETVARCVGERHERLRVLAKGKMDVEALASLAREVVEEAGRAVHSRASENPEHAGMGCTLTMLLFVAGKAVMAHVGDSRLYLCRDGRVNQISSDHTMANELAQAGLIERDEVSSHHYAHVLSRALGPRPNMRVDTLVMDVAPGDRFIICSDGLTEYVESESWLAAQLARQRDCQAAAEELVGFANAAGGLDNITVVVVEVRPDDPEIEISDEMSVDLQHRFDTIAGVFLFEGLSMALLARVLNCCELNEYKAGDVVVREGEPCAQLMVVVDGRFVVSRAGQLEGPLAVGDHACATTLLSPRRARATLHADGSGRLLVMKRDPFWRLVRQRPWLGVGLLERLGRRLSIDLDRSTERHDEARISAIPPEPRERI